jgi:hypothetical protein
MPTFRLQLGASIVIQSMVQQTLVLNAIVVLLESTWFIANKNHWPKSQISRSNFQANMYDMVQL